MWASDFLSQGLGENVFVERQIRDHPLQSRILVLERPQLPQLADTQVGVLLLPDIERSFADAELPSDIRRGRAAFDLAEGVRDLLFGELRLLHGPRSLREGPFEAAILL